jgi:hypothetical protein
MHCMVTSTDARCDDPAGSSSNEIDIVSKA